MYKEILTWVDGFKKSWSSPIPVGGFLIKLTYNVNPTSKDQLLDLFFSSRAGSVESWVSSLSKSDSVLPVWFNIVTSVSNKRMLYLRFFVPISMTTNNPRAFGIYYYDPLGTSTDEINNLRLMAVSNSNQAKNTDHLPFNQGRFNHGWNTIELELPDSVKLDFVPIPDFSIFGINSVNYPQVKEAKVQLDSLLRNSSFNQRNDNIANRMTVIENLSRPILYNKSRRLGKINGTLTFLIPREIPSGVVRRHDVVQIKKS